MSHSWTRWPAMGSTVEVFALDADERVLDWARVELAALEASWTRFDPASELCQLNASAGSGPVVVSIPLLDAIDASLRLWRATDGCFDPTTLAALEALGYDSSFDMVRARPVTRTAVVPSGEPAPVSSGPGLLSALGIVVDHERQTVQLPAGVRLDLGGVGKGLAADRIAVGMVERGASGSCVSVGGDVAVCGVTPDGGWRIGVSDPFEPDRDRWEIPLTRGAVVQSNCLVRSWGPADARRHHIVDPRTGTSADSGVVGAVVVADEAWWAEGVAKAAIVAGAVRGVEMIERLARAGWLVLADGSVVMAGSVGIRRAA